MGSFKKTKTHIHSTATIRNHQKTKRLDINFILMLKSFMQPKRSAKTLR